MQGHDIIVIGASAGGLKAITRIVRDLPVDLQAAVFVVQHFPADRPSMLADILSDVGPLPARAGRNGEPIEPGRIYTAPSDRHLLLHRETVQVVRGPQENRFRPSIDALFRSAARFHGPRVIGVVLTGALDDGTVGLQAIKSRGGITAVQDPLEADYPSMPMNALRFADPEHILPVDAIPDFLIRMTKEPAPEETGLPVSREVDLETRIASQDLQGEELLDAIDSIGHRTPYTCPACNGTLWEVGTGEPIRFRCHTGHAFTKDALVAGQNEALEHALWSAVRLMEEKANLYRHLSTQRKRQGHFYSSVQYEQSASALDQEALTIKGVLIAGEATATEPEPPDEKSGNEGSGTAPAESEALR